MTPDRIPAVLLGGAMNAIAVARSLRRAGVPVDVLGGSVGGSPVRSSRAARTYREPAPGEDVAFFWSGYLEGAEPSVILPCSDDGLEFIARRRKELVELGHRPIEADDDVLLEMLDKSTTYERARAAGVPAPLTATLKGPEDAALIDGFAFPAAVKPVHSHLFTRRFRPFAKGTMLASAAQAHDILGPILEERIAMLLTEMVEGTDECCSYYSYLDEDGQPLTHFTKRKLRQYPTRFGLGTYHLTAWQPEVADLGLRFFQAIGLRGMGNVEFKRDRRDGQLKLIECNPRFTNAHAQVVAAGIDFGLLAYARLTGIPLPPLESFRENVGLWFPVEDVRALRAYMDDGELTVAQWVRSLCHRQAFALFDWSDPWPSLHNGTTYLRAAARRLGPGRTTAAGEQESEELPDPYMQV